MAVYSFEDTVFTRRRVEPPGDRHDAPERVGVPHTGDAQRGLPQGSSLRSPKHLRAVCHATKRDDGGDGRPAPSSTKDAGPDSNRGGTGVRGVGRPGRPQIEPPPVAVLEPFVRSQASEDFVEHRSRRRTVERFVLVPAL